MMNSTDMMSMLRCSKTTLWRHINDGRLPKPIYFGRAPLWNQQHVERWLAEKMGVEPKPARKRDYDELC